MPGHFCSAMCEKTQHFILFSRKSTTEPTIFRVIVEQASENSEECVIFAALNEILSPNTTIIVATLHFGCTLHTTVVVMLFQTNAFCMQLEESILSRMKV